MLQKIFSSEYERMTYDKLFKICQKYGAAVFPKVRVADVIRISNSGISDEEYSFALKSHFDFTVCDIKSESPLFAVEFDGIYHKTEIQKRRDKIKNRLAERFDLPLLRINSRYLEKKYRDLDMLSWCIEVWFLADGFYKAQQSGSIPKDELFDPFSIIVSGNKKFFPFFLSYDIRTELKKLFDKKKIKSFNSWIGKDENNNYRGISWININDEFGLKTISGMKSQSFPIIESELLEEIMIFDLYEQLLNYFNNRSMPVLNQEIFKKFNIFESRYKLASFSFFGIKE